MQNYNPEVTKYIEEAAEFAQPILKHIRKIVHETCPEVKETLKWGMPYFDYLGSLLHMAAFKQHAVIGFPKQSLINGKSNIFQKDMEAMGSLGKITNISELPDAEILIDYLKQAIQLNIEGKKVTRTKHPKTALKMPMGLKEALTANKTAEDNYKKLSPSHQREYLEWILEAKREATRKTRIIKAIQMLTQGKSRNWQYN